MIVVAQSDKHSFRIALKQGKLHLISTKSLIMLDVAKENKEEKTEENKDKKES